MAQNVPNTPGTYYLLATTSFGLPPNIASGVAVSNAITVTTTPSPTLLLGLSPYSLQNTFNNPLQVNVGTTVYFYGTGYKGSTVNIYLNNVVNGTVLVTATVKNGVISGKFIVPPLPQASSNPANNFYYVVAYDNSPGGTGLTATQEISVVPSIRVSGSIPAGKQSFTLTIYGTGFLAGQTFAAFSSSSTGSSDVWLTPGSISGVSVSPTSGSINLFINSATVQPDGNVTITVTGVDYSGGVAPGPYDINMKYSNGLSVLTSPFVDAVFASSPSVPYTSSVFIINDLTMGGTTQSPIVNGYAGDEIQIIGYNFPASTSITIWFNNAPLGPFTTDANGFLNAISTVPNLPAGSYAVYAQGSSNGYNVYVPMALNPFVILPSFQVLDSQGNEITGEYIPVGSVVTVVGFNLQPNTEYYVLDSGLYTEYQSIVPVPLYASSPVYDGIATFVAGSAAPDGVGVMTNASGDFIFTYPINYSLPVTTGTEFYVYLTSSLPSTLPATAPSGAYTYYAVGSAVITPNFPSGYYSARPLSSPSITVSNLIPYGSNILLYPGVSNVYAFYFNGALQNVTISGTTECCFYVSGSPGSSASVTLSFTVPSNTPNGVYTLSVYSGKHTSTGFKQVSLAGEYPSFIVSTPASLVTQSGATGVFDPMYGTPSMVGSPYAIDMYGFTAGEYVDIITYTNLGPTVQTVVTDPNGAYQTSLASPMIVQPTVAGQYDVVLYRTTPHALQPSPLQYSVSAVASFVPDTSPYYPLNVYYAPASTTFNVYAYGLKADTYYNVYLNGQYQTSVETGDHGTMPSITLTAPSVPGSYNVTISLQSNPSVALFTLELVVLPNGVIFVPSNAAFPGQLVQFMIPAYEISLYQLPSGATNVINSVEVQVSLNGVPYATVPVSLVTTSSGVYYAGSFLMPNDPANTTFVVGLTPVNKVSYDLTTYVQQTGSLSATVSSSNSGSASGSATLNNDGSASFSVSLSDQYSIPSGQLSAALSDQNDLAGTATLTSTTSPYAVQITFSSPSGVPYSSTFEASGIAATGLYPLTVNGQATPYSIDVTSISGGITFTIYTTNNPTASYNGINYADIITSGSITLSSSSTSASISGYYYTPSSTLTVTTGSNWVPASTTITYAISGTGTVSGTPSSYYDIDVTSYSATPMTSTISGSTQTYYTGYQIQTTFNIYTDPSAAMGTYAIDISGVNLAYPEITSPTTIPSSTDFSGDNYYSPTYTGTVSGSTSGSVTVTLSSFSSQNTLTSSIGSTPYELVVVATPEPFSTSPIYTLTGVELQIYTPTAQSGSTPNYLSSVADVGSASSSITASMNGIYTTEYANLTVDVTTPSVGTLTFSLTSTASGATATSGPYTATYTLTAAPTKVTTIAGSGTGYYYADSVSYTISTTSAPSNGMALLSTAAETTSASSVSGTTGTVSYTPGSGSLLNTGYSTDYAVLTFDFTTPAIGTETATVESTGSVPVSPALSGYSVNVQSFTATFASSAYTITMTVSFGGSGNIQVGSETVTSITSQAVTLSGTQPVTPLPGSFTYLSPVSSFYQDEVPSSTLYNSYMLVSGNGALLTGITQSQMATLEAKISNDITTTMQVPLSELNASIASINDAVATIKTAFGTMQASLQAINASIASINGNLVTLKTDLGTVQTSLSNLNATVVGISHGVATLNTAVGQVQTSLSNLNASVVSISNGVATLKTSVGEVQTSLSNLNATVVSGLSSETMMLESINSSVSNLSGQVTSLSGMMTTDYSSVMSSLASISTLISNVKDSVSSLSSALSSDYSSMSSALSSLSSSVSSIGSTVSSTSTTVSSISSSLPSLQSSISSLESSVSTMTTYLLVVAVLAIIIIVIELVLLVRKK